MIAVIVNPNSANGSTGKYWPEIRNMLKSELGEIDTYITQNHLHAMELSSHALKNGAEIVITVGGDGTVNEVINGFYENGELINREVKLAVISSGTGGDFIKSFDFPQHPREVASIIKQNTPQHCDLVHACLNPVDTLSHTRYFINIADVGFGALVADLVNRTSKFLGGKASFLLGAIRAVIQYQNKPLKVELDNRLICNNVPHFFAAVSNGKYFGGGMYLTPEAQLNDGFLDLVLVGDLNFQEKIQLARSIYQGECDKLEKIHYFRGRRVKITCYDNVFIEADGELVGSGDVEFTILPSAIQVFGL